MDSVAEYACHKRNAVSSMQNFKNALDVTQESTLPHAGAGPLMVLSVIAVGLFPKSSTHRETKPVLLISGNGRRTVTVLCS
jgi:hypothetical protein